ncbi:MAG: hypothetical protein IKW87_00740 [Ruminococcus sp.]|nr:hypothetical protein [Ruminococcus sp.]
MQLYLDLDGIEFHFCITEYEKSIPENLYKLYDQWCIVKLSLHSESWLNYQISSEILLSCEVEEIRDKISDLLEDKIQAQEVMEFIEPDFTFVLNPKKNLRNDSKYTYIAHGHEIVDIDADLQIHFWNDGLTANYLSLCFDRKDLECLLIYLRCITNEICQDDESVQKLIEDNVIQI